MFLARNLKTGNFKTLITLPYTFLSIQTTPTRALYSKVLFCSAQPKEIQIILRLFLVINIYCQASSSQFNQSLNLARC